MVHFEMGKVKRGLTAAVATFTILSTLALAGCGGSNGKPGGNMKVWFPDADTLQFEAVLSDSQSFSIDGDIMLPPYGDIYFLPPSATQGFTFGARLNVKAFLPDSWGNLGEVTRLPTGAFFPAWVKTALVQVPAASDFNVYLGVREQRALGVSWSFVDSTSIPIGVGANYYDDKGNLVIGGLFYPPLVVNGQVTEKGGLFIATDLTPFLPSTSATQLASVAADTMLKTFGQSKVNVKGRQLTVKYYAVEKGRQRSVKYSDSTAAQRYLKALSKASAKKGRMTLKAD